MKIKADIVSVANDAKQRWTGQALLTVEARASGDHDDRDFKFQVPAYLGKSFPVGRCVWIEIRPA